MVKLPNFSIFSRSSKAFYPRLPEGHSIYAIGDIHGRDDLLAQVHDAVDSDRAVDRAETVTEIYLGDYVDRGNQSAEVISRLIARKTSRTVIFVRGNHDQIFLDFHRGEKTLQDFLAMDGITTLSSYGVTVEAGTAPNALHVRDALIDAMPAPHVTFLETARSSCQLGEYVFVHAGLRPGIPLDKQSDEDLLWIRDDFLNHSGSFGGVVVHGHTPVARPDFHRNRINIDTGAYITNRLTCLKISSKGPEVLHITGLKRHPQK